MNIVIRVDASNRIGTGHLVRCLTLARALADRGATISFLCRDHPGQMEHLITSQDFSCELLPPPGHDVDDADDSYRNWLGASQQEDARQTLDLIGTSQPDWLIVDHYGISAQWEMLVKDHVQRLMVIDDLANRMHCCDLLLDQNFSDNAQQRYSDRVAASTIVLIGPKYALLHPEYAAVRKSALVREHPVSRVFVFFGGADSSSMTAKTLQALSADELSNLSIDVVIGANNPDRTSIEALAVSRANCRVWNSLPHLAHLMAQADIAVGAGGGNVWERMCVGLPSIVVSIADNQVPISNLLDAHGLIRYLGESSNVTVEQLTDCLKDEIGGGKYIGRSCRSMAICDGQGTQRIVEMLLSGNISELTGRWLIEHEK